MICTKPHSTFFALHPTVVPKGRKRVVQWNPNKTFKGLCEGVV